jgi:hypothetical protein
VPVEPGSVEQQGNEWKRRLSRMTSRHKDRMPQLPGEILQVQMQL